ncbi:short-chain dehydrogenase [Colletotrichum asianum]|uniref:Short-chain dehydrogenase n=1 Tax=Colletotrichum asianum TaxID=702518 RepID=A0A8H3W3H9_9PEZI|nr:short-chain dehydrogenase [Colletotrichum asianum]
MSTLEINSKDFVKLKDKVILITGIVTFFQAAFQFAFALPGGSSGIGLGVVKLLLSIGARVTSVDLTAPPASEDFTSQSPTFTFEKCNVCDWKALRSVFSRVVEREGRLDAVFANAGNNPNMSPGAVGSRLMMRLRILELAGVNPRTRFIDDEIDPTDGQLKEPDLSCLETNLYGVISTVKLAVHHMRAREIQGSIVITASVSSWTRFGAVDYTTSKHAVLGFMRGLLPHTSRLPVPIRINCIAPNWTKSGLVTEEIVAPTGFGLSTPEEVAQSVGLLMTDKARNGEVIFVDGGRYWEIGKTLEGDGVGSFVGPAMPPGTSDLTNWEQYVEFCRRMNMALGIM